MRWASFILAVWLLLPGIRGSAETLIEFFQQPGCEECRRIRTLLLPELEERFSGRYRLEQYDTGETDHYLRLVHYQEQLNYRGNDSACLVLNRRILLAGYRQIEQELMPSMERLLAEEPRPAEASASIDDLRRRAELFTVGMIAAAGFLDGINPCIFATLVFFLSWLTVMKIRGARLLLAGGMYCLACFLTYLLLGLGLIRAIEHLSGYWHLRYTLEAALLVFLLLFAALSFRDAWNFRRRGAAAVSIQLPDRIKRLIQKVLKWSSRDRFLPLGAFAAGAVVTLLESVCTGQLYLPTLALTVREFGMQGRWMALLILYNVMFILPLLFLFAAVHWGVRTPRLLAWSKRNVVISKVLLGLFFLLMALFLILPL